jgi:cell wall-associated NlpC family hydrolase
LLPGCGNTREHKIEDTISGIKNKYAPDKRIVIFNVTINHNGKLSVNGETSIDAAYHELDSLLKADFQGIDNHVVLLPDPSLDSLIMGIVTVSVANIRGMPDHSAELVTQAILGTPVKILKKESEWYLVQTPDSYLGWMTSSSIITCTETYLLRETRSVKIIYTELTGTCYSEPDINSPPVSDIVAGSILETTGLKMGFCEVMFPDSRKGYVLQDQCQLFEDFKKLFPPNQDDIVKTAGKFTGIPYLWGGTSSKGVDCSGFTKTVYFMNGIILQRDASQQAQYGELIDTRDNFDNLRPGDLLFFGIHKTDSTEERISHVGIYIGNGEIIHSSGMVKRNSLIAGKENYSSQLAGSYILARRILTCIGQPGIQSVFTSKLYY